jgi:hypothetical protein
MEGGSEIWRSMKNEGPYRGHVGVGFFFPKPPNFGVDAHIKTPLELLLL